MPHWQGKRPITIVTACMRSDGLPDFALTEVEVTYEEFENGMHYVLAEERLSDRGHEEPYVHFDESEGPSFLLPAVRQYLTCKTTELHLQETR
jgi:hypothetical protein